MSNEKISAKELRRLYIKEWRAKNKDRVKRYNEQYWERKAAQMNEQREKEVNR